MTATPSGFNAFGHEVPVIRQVNALDCAVEVIGIPALEADPVITEAALRVQRDEPDKALLVLRNITDLSGAYRLLSNLCTADPLKAAS